MQNFLKKLTSRKFLAALAGVATGLAMVFGVDETTISTVAGAVTTVASVVSYIMSEGMVDAAAVGAGKDKGRPRTPEITVRDEAPQSAIWCSTTRRGATTRRRAIFAILSRTS